MTHNDPSPFTLADVAIPVGVRTPFTYLIPPELQGIVRAGHRVGVPLGRRKTHGYVVRVHGDAPAHKLKALLEVDPVEPVFDADLLELTRWVAEYYLAPWGEVLEAAAPRGGAPQGTRRRKKGKAGDGDAAMGGDGGIGGGGGIAGDGVIAADGSVAGEAAIAGDGALAEGAASDPALSDTILLSPALEPAPPLEPEQRGVFDRLLASVQAGRFAVHLLHGVPGSGKTEIYLALADAVIRSGGSVLLLEPEIGLATQILARVRRRFGNLVGLYHSMTGSSERRRTWERARSGEIRIVVGARSAVFVPIPRLRLVIVDEEQEPAYKQEDSPRYHGRDTAIVRARQGNAVVVLGTATPSLEAWWNARSGKFIGHVLERRYGSRPLAPVSIVDLKVDPGRKRDSRSVPLFSGELIQKVRLRLLAGEQTLLFLNRRGHSTVVQCSDCGEMFRCRSCEVVLTYHRATSDLRCHHCGLIMQKPATCSACKSEALFYGGIGTQKLEEKLAGLFPQARILRVDADSTRRRGSHAAHLAAIEGGDVDILIGTQMLAKGLDFPRVTLVGVLLADREMGLPELRSSERAFQLLTQVAGRAGRGTIPGEVVMQTLLPGHYVIRSAAAGDYDSFADEEIALRRKLGFPPFSRMIHILFDGRVDATVEKRAAGVASILARPAGREQIQVLGPAPMFLSRLKGLYRWHLSLNGRSSEGLHRLARLALESAAPAGTRGVRIHVDVDPIHTL
jgi:primosomal protein N' (replication factor Y) (superfamily II helicase)